MNKITYEEFLIKEKTRKPSKFKNKRMWVNGYVFHSQLEGKRYKQLLLLEKNGCIEQLELQPRFRLYKSFKINTNKKKNQGILPIDYVSDFKYIENDLLIIEDTKGKETADYIIKKKWFVSRLAEFEVDVFREYKSARKIIDYTKLKASK